MTKKLDLYLEKIIAKMNLDDAQRESVEREFRAHLEEAIREGTEKGLTQNQAETEAMLSFGQPSVIARQFGVTHGYAWFVFERFCVSFILYLLLKGIFPRIIAAPLGILFFVSIIWNKIEVNGTLHIRRLFRRSLNIPFEDIKNVVFEKGHLWGKRRLRLNHVNGTLKISYHIRNFRCAAMALDVLCPDAVDPKVSGFIKRLKLRIRKETSKFRWGISIYWIMVLILYLVSFPWIWSMKGISVFFPISLILLFPGLIFQALRHTDRSKVGICWILTFVSLVYVSLYILAILISFCSQQYMSLGFFFILSFALITVWWKGKRSRLLLVCGGALILFLLMIFIPSSTIWKGEIKTIASIDGIFWENLLSKDNTLYSIVSTDMEKEKHDANLLIATEKESRIIPLPKGEFGNWRVSRMSESESVAIFYTPRLKSFEWEKQEYSKVYIYNPKDGLSLLSGFPENAYYISSEIDAFSPGDNYIITPIMEITDEGKNSWRLKLAFFYLPTRKCVKFEGVYLEGFRGWIDENTYEIIGSKYNEEEKENQFEIWHLNLETGEKKLKGKYRLKEDLFISQWAKGAYIPIQTNSKKECAIMNKFTGEITSPIVKDVEKIFYSIFKTSWCPEKEYLTCVVSSENKKEIVVIAPDRIVKIIPVSFSEDIKNITISPDGSKILVGYKYVKRFMILSNLHFRIIDLVRDNQIEIERLDLLQTLFSFIIELAIENYVNWQSDSRSVAYLISTMNLKGGKAKTHNQSLLVKYEDWAEENL